MCIARVPIQCQKSIAVPVAEAKFFRAYCYFELVQLYGNVILLTEPVDIDSPKMNAVRDDRGLVIDQCIQDLQDAANGLPDTPSFLAWLSSRVLGRSSTMGALMLQRTVSVSPLCSIPPRLPPRL